MLPIQAGDDRHPAHDAFRSCRLLIIADDLTGAADAAVAFTAIHDEVRVHLHPSDLGASGVVAVTTNTRDLPPAAATSRVESLSAMMPVGCEIFKKIDSVFRGNTLAEIAASVHAFPADLVIIAPAYPALGRFVHGGVLDVDGPAPRSIAIAPRLLELGCNPTHLASSNSDHELARQMQSALAAGNTVLVCDASSQIHLETVVRAAHSLNARTLWIGSGGLAHALASQMPRLATPAEPQFAPGHTLFFIGSDHPVSRGQTTHLRRISGVGSSRCDEDALASGDHLFHISRETSAADIQRATAHLRAEDIGCLFMTGGDTALLVCDALGITSLKLQAEFAPGIPIAVAEGGRLHGTSVILKSGGFGERSLLCSVLDAFARKEIPAAS